MEIKENVMYFNSDDEFTDFALDTNPSVGVTDTGLSFYDYPFTPAYDEAIAAGRQFVINDPCSKVMKHKCVNRGVITKRVSNLYDI